MDKKKIISIIVFVVLGVFFIFGGYKYAVQRKEQKENEAREKREYAEKRYDEIRESVKKAVEWNIGAQYPKCSIAKEFRETDSPGSFYNSSFLINNGYIKKSELLDVDEKSYCDVYVDINTFYEDPLDHQKNCEVYYKIYLKCKDYEDEGYINWGN